MLAFFVFTPIKGSNKPFKVIKKTSNPTIIAPTFLAVLYSPHTAESDAQYTLKYRKNGTTIEQEKKYLTFINHSSVVGCVEF